MRATSSKTEAHNTAGLMRRHIFQGFAKAALLGDEADLANFLTYGFAELEFQVRPSRQDLVLALFKVLMEVFRSLKMPVVVAFDQLEDLLLARRSDDAHSMAEAFFAGIVQVMHQIDGLCFLIFAERGLWNRFVPSLDGYIQDRLNNPVHVPEARHDQGDAPRSAAAGAGAPRGRGPACGRAWTSCPTASRSPDIYPFTDEQVDAHRPHRADAARHAPAVPPPVRPRRLRPGRRRGVGTGVTSRRQRAASRDGRRRRRRDCRRRRGLQPMPPTERAASRIARCSADDEAAAGIDVQAGGRRRNAGRPPPQRRRWPRRRRTRDAVADARDCLTPSATPADRRPGGAAAAPFRRRYPRTARRYGEAAALTHAALAELWDQE